MSNARIQAKRPIFVPQLLSNAKLGHAWCWVLLLNLGCAEVSQAPPSEFQGVIEFETRALSFEVAGKLTQVSISEGDVLSPGQEIARLDDKLERLNKVSLEAQRRETQAKLKLLYAGTRPEHISRVRAQLRAARATATYASEQYERSRVLHQHNVVTTRELDEAKNKLEQAQATESEVEQQLVELRRGPRSQEIEAAEARLDGAVAAVETAEERIRRHILYCEKPAEVIDVPLHAGEYASPGTPVVTLASTDQPFVDVFVPQARINEFAVGTKVGVRVDSLSKPLGGRVGALSPSTEFTPRFLFSPRERPNLVVRVRVNIHDPNHELHSGVPAFLELDTRLAASAFPSAPHSGVPSPSPLPPISSSPPAPRVSGSAAPPPGEQE